MPEWREEVRRRLRSARLGGAAESEVVEELVQHLDDRYAELLSRGEAEADARRLALLELDEEGSLGDRVRDAKRAESPAVAIGAAPHGSAPDHALRGVLADLRVGLRMLRRAPGFTIVATLVIALGIGANTAVFSVVNALLLRPLPGVSAPDQLAMVWTSDFSGPIYGASSYPDVEAMRESGAFMGIAVRRPGPFSIAINDGSVQVLGEVVSAEYFAVLGVRPAAGRFFLSEESGAQGTAPVIVISHAFWQKRLNGTPDIIGRPLRVNGQMLTIVGVAPPDFRGVLRGVRMDAWVTTASPTTVSIGDFTNRGHRGFLTVARLHENTTIEATQERLNGLATQLHAAYPSTWTDINSRSRVLTVLPESASRVPRQARGTVLGMV
ncbi:MAG: ABC transporter permease, partial [Longimicrobiales bacterium]